MKKIDGRRNNGGNSTKTTSGIDKRKNQYRQALEAAATVEDVSSVIRSVFSAAVRGDITASKLFLEYYLGKPTQIIETNNTHNINEFDLSKLYDSEAQREVE